MSKEYTVVERLISAPLEVTMDENGELPVSDKRLIFPCGAYFPLRESDEHWLESAHRAKDGAYRIGTYPASCPIVDLKQWESHRNRYLAPKGSDGEYRCSCLWGCPTPKRRKIERGFDEQGNLGEYVSCFARLHQPHTPLSREQWKARNNEPIAGVLQGDEVWDDITPTAPVKCPHCEEQKSYVQACKRAAKAGEGVPDREAWGKCPQCGQYRELTSDTGLCATCQLVLVVEANRR